MRLGLVTTSYSRFDDDGNARFVRSIAEAQAALGHEVHVLAPYSPQIKPYPSCVHVHWFKYVWPARIGVMGHAAALENDRHLRGSVLWQTPLFSLSLTVQLGRLISKFHLDVIHAHWVLPSGVLAALSAQLSRKRLYISLHGSDIYLAQQKAFYGYLAHWAFTRASGVTACSQTLANAAVKLGARSDRTWVVPYGADPRRFTVESFESDLRTTLGFSPQARVIVAVGRLVGKKGFVELLRAMPEVAKVFPDVHLIIIGDGPERVILENLKNELSLNNNVHLPGPMPWSEIPKYLGLADVFVMPSIRDSSGNLDGLPNVILEAMASGRPVVATRIGGISLAVRDGETGILVDEPDPTQLGAAILRVLQLPDAGRTMGLAGRQRIETELNWMTLARRYDQLYELL